MMLVLTVAVSLLELAPLPAERVYHSMAVNSGFCPGQNQARLGASSIPSKCTHSCWQQQPPPRRRAGVRGAGAGTQARAGVCTGVVLAGQPEPQFSSVQFSRSVVFDSLQPHESQHARPPCPSPTPGVQGTLKSLLQHHSSKASILQCSAFFMV